MSLSHFGQIDCDSAATQFAIQSQGSRDSFNLAANKKHKLLKIKSKLQRNFDKTFLIFSDIIGNVYRL